MSESSAIGPAMRTNLASSARHSDPLADVFGAIRMAGAAFFRVSARAPWVAEQPAADAMPPRILPPGRHLIAYHIVTEGSCYASLVGGNAVRLEAGQVIVFTRGDRHMMSSQPGLCIESFSNSEFNESGPPLWPYVARFSANGPVTARLVCGFLACDSWPFNPLLDNLPRILIGDCTKRAGLPSLRELVALAIAEASCKRAGGQMVLGRLTELMLVEVVRQHVERLPAGHATWLAGLKDVFVGRALALMHSNPGRRWSLGGLAREIGLSRSLFAARFNALVGMPPMEYLTRWRMQTATGLLRDSVNIADVANEVGYSSEASFSRAFKKIVGVPPSRWRRRVDLLAA